MQQALLKRVLCHVILVSVAPPAPLYTTIFYIFLSRSLSLALALSRSLHCPRCSTCLCSDAILMKAVTSRQFIMIEKERKKMSFPSDLRLLRNSSCFQDPVLTVVYYLRTFALQFWMTCHRLDNIYAYTYVYIFLYIL